MLKQKLQESQANQSQYLQSSHAVIVAAKALTVVVVKITLHNGFLVRSV